MQTKLTLYTHITTHTHVSAINTIAINTIAINGVSLSGPQSWCFS